jgi:hypothetical protein
MTRVCSCLGKCTITRQHLHCGERAYHLPLSTQKKKWEGSIQTENSFQVGLNWLRRTLLLAVLNLRVLPRILWTESHNAKPRRSLTPSQLLREISDTNSVPKPVTLFSVVVLSHSKQMPECHLKTDHTTSQPARLIVHKAHATSRRWPSSGL